MSIEATTIHSTRTYRGYTLRRVSGSQLGYRTPWVEVTRPDGTLIAAHADTYAQAERLVDIHADMTDEDRAHRERVLRLLEE